jgi:phage-related minor tail protein
MAATDVTFRLNAVGNAVPEMKKVQAQLGNLDQTIIKSTANMNRHVKGMHNISRANKGLTRNLGMASLQFQDMAVQASMGTDALRIMTMQAPQLASIFGPKGMILGALIAVGGAIAMMGDKTTKTSFDFKRFGQDIGPALEPFKKAWEGVKYTFNLVKEAMISGVNLIINAFQYMVAIFSAIPESFRRFVDAALGHWFIFKQSIIAGAYDARAAIQDMLDFFSMSGPKEGFLGFMDDETGHTAAENLRFLAKVARNQAALVEDQMEKAGAPVDAFSEKLANIKLIDLRDYFKRVKEEAEKTGAAVTTVADMIGDKFGDAFMSMVDGTMKAKDAFRTMAAEIIKELFRIFVVKKITGMISGALTSSFPSLGTPMKAIGGPVQRGKPYIVGERGPELFVPSRTGSIVSNDKISGGESVVVQQTINISTGVQQTVRNEIRNMLPMISESAKGAVLDAKRRGGSYGRAFA